MTTANTLVRHIYDDIIPYDYISVIADYFNIENTSDDKIQIIFGLYQGLVKFKGVTEELLHKCCITNRLDELINKKYRHKPSGYYNLFLEKRIKLCNHYIHEKEEFEIYDDDHCPYCNEKGYYTQNNTINMDCPKCLKFICKKCIKYDNDECMAYHIDCFNKK